MIASVAVVMTVFPALFAAVLALGSHIAAEALSPPRLMGSRLLGKVSAPVLFMGWLGGLATLFLLSMAFGALALFFTLIPPSPSG